MPSERKSQPATAHFCERVTHILSARPSSSAEIANANGTASPTYPTNSAGGWSTIPGCSSSGFRPRGTVPGAAATNGLEPSSSTMSAANTPPTMQSTITAPPVRRCALVRSRSAITTATMVMSSSHKRNEPCCPAQNPAMR